MAGFSSFTSQVMAALGRLRLFATAALPSSPPTGQLVYDTTTDGVKVANNAGTFTAVGGGGGGITIGQAVAGGAANSVIFEDGAQNLATSTNLLFTTAGGLQASAGSATDVVVGSATNAATGGTGGTSTVVGNAATNSGNAANATLLGSGASNLGAGTGVIAIGVGAGVTAAVTSTDSIAIGRATVVGTGGGASLRAIAIGATNNTSAANDTCLIGFGLTAQTANALVIGNTTGPYNNSWLGGKGQISSSATTYAINGTGGSGADNAGGNLVIAAGQSTGAGAPANVTIQTTVVAGSSSTPQALANAAVYASGWQRLANGEVALNGNYTNATAGFTATALSVTVVSGRTYSFECCLFFDDSTAADGAQFDFNGGTAAATNFRAQAFAVNVTGAALVLTNGAVTALATAIQVALALTTQAMIVVRGTFVPSGAGTFIVRAAQTAHSAGTLTVDRGSYLTVRDATPL